MNIEECDKIKDVVNFIYDKLDNNGNKIRYVSLFSLESHQLYNLTLYQDPLFDMDWFLTSFLKQYQRHIFCGLSEHNPVQYILFNLDLSLQDSTFPVNKTEDHGTFYFFSVQGRHSVLHYDGYKERVWKPYHKYDEEIDEDFDAEHDDDLDEDFDEE